MSFGAKKLKVPVGRRSCPYATPGRLGARHRFMQSCQIVFLRCTRGLLALEAYHHQPRRQLQRLELNRLVSSSSRKAETQPLFNSIAPPFSHSRMLMASKQPAFCSLCSFAVPGGDKIAFQKYLTREGIQSNGFEI